MENENANTEIATIETENKGADLLNKILDQTEGTIPSGTKEAHMFAVDAMYAYFKPIYEELRDTFRDTDSRMSDDEYMNRQNDIQKDREVAYEAILKKYPPAGNANPS